MDVIYIRALIPTFSWGEPHNGGLSTTWSANKTLSYVLPRTISESCLSARLRASSRVHSQCTQPSSLITGSVLLRPRPMITHPRHTKNHAVWNCKLAMYTAYEVRHTRIGNAHYAFPKVLYFETEIITRFCLATISLYNNMTNCQSETMVFSSKKRGKLYHQQYVCISSAKFPFRSR